MNNDNKSIAYAFIANGVQIYLNDEDHFLVSKLICVDCGNSWYTNLTECFLCGAINPFLYRCSSCGKFQSITKSGDECSNCRLKDLKMVCPNPDCLSNTNKDISKEANKYGGIFNKESGLSIAQQFCLSCGSKHHTYKNYEIHVRVADKDEIEFKKLNIFSKYMSNNSYLIVKYKPNTKTLKYGLYRIKDIHSKKFKLWQVLRWRE